MTTNIRCIKCELVWEEKDITYDQFCKTCDRNIASNDARRRYWNAFCGYCKELFYLRYPDPNHSWITIPSDNEGKAKMVKEAKNRLVAGIIRKKEEIKRMEKNNDDSSQLYKDTVADISQLEQQIPLIVNLEGKYK